MLIRKVIVENIERYTLEALNETEVHQGGTPSEPITRDRARLQLYDDQSDTNHRNSYVLIIDGEESEQFKVGKVYSLTIS